MAKMQCHEFEQVLEQQEAQRLPADAAAHLNECGQCRALVTDLEVIQAAARNIAAEEAAPPEQLWLSLRTRLEAEGLIRTEEAHAWAPRRVTAWLSVLPRPALAGAYLSLLLAAAVLIGTQVISRPPSRAVPSIEPPAATAALDSQLNTVERRTVSALHQHNPAVTASLRQNLDIVDNFIALCEKSVREEPQSALAREYLYGAYQQKADLLAMMMDQGAGGD